jgi:hypothetical protein
VAAFARLAWLADKPFWRDEAWVAAMARVPLVEFEPSPRPVPTGFLLATALAARLPLLPPEVSLRLLPVLAGLGTVVLVHALARALGARPGAASAAAWLAAGMPALVYYSRELKPYALDALLAVAVPWLAWRAFADEEDGPARALGGVLAVAPWITFGSLFPIGATLGWAATRAGRVPRLRARCAVLALAYAASLGAAYRVILREQASYPRLVQAWQPEIAALREGPRPVAAARGAALYARVAFTSFFPVVWPAAAALALLGILTWPGPGRALLAWQLAGGAVLATAFALAGRYLLTEGRLLLFAAPALAVLAAGGLAAVARTAGTWLPRPAAVTTALAAVVAVAWSAPAVAWRVRPYQNDPALYFRYDVLHDVEPVIAEAARRASPGDPVITSRYTGEQFRVYARGRLPQAFVCTRANCLDEGPPMRAWLEGVKGRGWMILLEEEDRPWRRDAVRRSGFDLREAAKGRGTRLWEIRRRATGATTGSAP